MKIVIIVNKLSGGGAERVAALWATGFSTEGHEVTVITTKKARQTYPTPDSVHVRDIDVNIGISIIDKLRRRILWHRKLREIFFEIQPDVVIAVLPKLGPLIFKAKGNLNFKVIGTDHNSYERPNNVPLSKKHEYLKFEFNKRFDAVTILTEADKKVIGNRLTNVFVLPNPLAFEPVKEIPAKKKILLAVGRLDAGYYKGFDILIKAFGLSCNNGWILQIAGNGKPESFERYKQLARECGVGDKVEFLGFVDDPLPYYRDASIFVLSSRWEGFGMVLIEAMSQGCASIACDYKGRQAEIITNEKEGLLCATDNLNALADAMDRMITDEQYRYECQVNAVIRSKYYSIENVCSRWNEIFKKIDLI